MSDATGPASASGGRIAVVTVHGTNDTAKDGKLDGEKWFQKGSTFTTALLKALEARGVTAEIAPFLWSGANSAQGREQGADKLADTLKQYRNDYSQVHIIGHSHGGNVANEAADFLRWGRRKDAAREPITSMITVGTPFFRRSSSAGETFGGLLFMLLTVLSGLMFAFFAVVLLYLMITGELHTQPEGGATAVAADLTEIIVTNSVFLALFAVNTLGMVLMARLAVTGVRRLLRPTSTRSTRSSITALWHPNDEAIAFLQKVDQLPVAPLAKGALFRGSRTNAIIWGVRVVIALGIAAVYQLFAQATGRADLWLPYGVPGNDAMFPGVPDNMIFTALFTPIIFFTVYLVFRFLFGLLPEWTLRDPINQAFGGMLKSMAFGRDGDVNLSEVATLSHTHPTEQIILQGDVHDRMRNGAAKAAASLIEKYRWSLLSIGTDPNAALKDLANDAQTWDSLIHTTYFDQAEVVGIIADRIAEKAKRAP